MSCLFRRSATLRDIATLLHVRDPTLSSPLALHTFRTVSFEHGQYRARHVGAGITRLSSSALKAAVADVLRDIDGGDSRRTAGKDSEMIDGQREPADGPLPSADDAQKVPPSPALFRQIIQQSQLEFPREADGTAGRQTLDELGFADGSVLDVVIKEPRLVTAPGSARGALPSGRTQRIMSSSASTHAPPLVPSAAIPPEAHPWGPGGDARRPAQRAERGAVAQAPPAPRSSDRRYADHPPRQQPRRDSDMQYGDHDDMDDNGRRHRRDQHADRWRRASASRSPIAAVRQSRSPQR